MVMNQFFDITRKWHKIKVLPTKNTIYKSIFLTKRTANVVFHRMNTNLEAKKIKKLLKNFFDVCNSGTKVQLGFVKCKCLFKFSSPKSRFEKFLINNQYLISFDY